MPKTGSPKAVAVWFHGQGGTADTRMNEDWLNSLRSRGWAVASSDFHGNAWGTPATVRDTENLTAWARETAGAEVRLFVAGSMGGLASLNALTHGQTVACWYGTMPVVDHGAVRNVPKAQEQIRAAWGSGISAAYIPAQNLDKLPQQAKYRIVTSPQDTWVPATANAALLDAEERLDVSALTVTGEHGDPSHFNPADLAVFADGCDD